MAAEKNILFFVELAILPGRFPAYDALDGEIGSSIPTTLQRTSVVEDGLMDRAMF